MPKILRPVRRRAFIQASLALGASQVIGAPFILTARGDEPVKIGMVNPLTGGGIISGMTGGILAGKFAAKAVVEGDFSEEKLKKYEQLCKEEFGKSFKKYLKVKNYLLSLSDKELDSIAKAFKNIDFESVDTKGLIKELVKISPKALLKLGRLF